MHSCMMKNQHKGWCRCSHNNIWNKLTNRCKHIYNNPTCMHFALNSNSFVNILKRQLRRLLPCKLWKIKNGSLFETMGLLTISLDNSKSHNCLRDWKVNRTSWPSNRGKIEILFSIFPISSQIWKLDKSLRFHSFHCMYSWHEFSHLQYLMNDQWFFKIFRFWGSDQFGLIPNIQE